MDMGSWADMLISAFPQLASENYAIVGDPTDQYNCIAYAAGDTSRWWEHSKGYYWPRDASRSSSIESLKQIFLGLGFQPCSDSSVKAGYQKIALYEQEGSWTHAALQMPSGRWRSKIGQGPVIEHQSPQSLSGSTYGEPTIYMARATGTV